MRLARVLQRGTIDVPQLEHSKVNQMTTELKERLGGLLLLGCFLGYGAFSIFGGAPVNYPTEQARQEAAIETQEYWDTQLPLMREEGIQNICQHGVDHLACELEEEQ